MNVTVWTKRAGTSPVVAGIAVVAGVLTASGGARPTGVVWFDLAIVALAAALVTALASRSPWWSSTSLAAVAAVTVSHVLFAVLTGLAAVGASVLAARRAERPEVSSVVAGVGVVALAHSDLEEFLGASAIVAFVGSLIVLVPAWATLNVLPRRRVRVVVLATAAVAAIALVGLVVSGLGVRDDARLAIDEARAAIDQVGAGDYAAAADGLERSAERFERVDAALASPWALPARLIPIVSQNVRAGALLTSTAADTLGVAASALREADPDALRVRGGSIDIDAVRAVEAPLGRVRGALGEVEAALGEARSVWLLGPVNTRLNEVDVDLVEQRPSLDRAIEAVRLAPRMLGADGTRRYLVLFTTPAEARGLGGFIGNYAEVTVDDGQIEVSATGRRSDLEDVLADVSFVCDVCSRDYLDRYGRFGMTREPGGTAAGRTWSNLTMGAHYPDVAQAAAALYEVSGGRPVDGVFVMDPYGVQAVMGFGGPVEIAELGVTLDPADAAQYILVDQYRFADDANDDRIDALDVLAGQVFAQLLSGELPPPTQILDDFGPLVNERRVLGWSADADEQALFTDVGLAGVLPELGVDGGFSVSVSNAAANKLDVFLDRDVAVEVAVDDMGARRLVATVTFTNGAPTSGLPDFVIGNLIDEPVGTSRLYVTFYGPAREAEITVDGEPVAVAGGVEAGWFAHSLFTTMGSGESVTFTVEYPLAAGMTGADANPVRFEQPLTERTRR